MTPVQSMLDANPHGPGSLDKAKLVECIQACFECAQTCTACADVCVAVGKILSRHPDHNADMTRAVLEACRTACRACADECGRHASMHRHCGECAEACRRCEQACADLLASMG